MDKAVGDYEIGGFLSMLSQREQFVTIGGVLIAGLLLLNLISYSVERGGN
jgi:hypothetical protein